jgi:hypothetical protein
MKTLVFAMFMAIAAQTATAAPITFTFTTAGAGTWTHSDGTNVHFGLDTPIEVTLVAETSQLQNPLVNYVNGNPIPGVIGYGQGTTVTASLSLAGAPLGALANNTYVFRNGQLVGFGDSVDFDIFGISNAALSVYPLDTALAPITGFGYFPGVTHIALASGDTVTLTALSQTRGVTLSAAVAPEVPEPATLSLLITGLVVVSVRRRVRM